MIFRRTWAEVSARRLRLNFRSIQDFVSPAVTVCAVVKADAYGHGAQACARALEAEGAQWFGVTSTHEGMLLREAGVTGRILVMAGFFPGEEDALFQHHLTPTIWSHEHVEQLEQAGERRGESIRVHLKVDTGMARLGCSMAELPEIARRLHAAKHVHTEGFFSHLASADVIGARDVDAQMAQFERARGMVNEAGLTPELLHIANSAAVASRPQSWMNFVRPGLSLYGYYPALTSANGPLPHDSYQARLKPALTWKTRVLALRDVPAGQAIGYSGAYVTRAPARIATLPIGYADGLNRHLSSKGRVIVRDACAPIVGNVAMDLTIIDVTAIPNVELGDEVTVLGASGHGSITPFEHAQLCGTVPYEILCAISKRVPRKFVD